MAAIGHFAVRHIADRTGTNVEYVHRYLRGMPPTAEFIAKVCVEFDISADWLLMARGPMRASDARHHALRETPAPDLLSALSVSVQRLQERIERAESVVRSAPPASPAAQSPAAEQPVQARRLATPLHGPGSAANG